MICYVDEETLSHLSGPPLEDSEWSRGTTRMVCETCGRMFAVTFYPRLKVIQMPMYNA